MHFVYRCGIMLAVVRYLLREKDNNIFPAENGNNIFKEETKMKQGLKPRELTLLGLLTALLLAMSYTPLGYLNIGPLAATLNMIPVAIAAIALGPLGGGITGGVFGITSFLQCIGIGGVSQMGAVLFGINPVFAFLQRFVPRVLTGLLIAYIYRGVRKAINHTVAGFVTGFCAAFLNTVLFMGALVLLFGHTEYLQGLIDGRNILLFICTFVGVNAVFEMVTSTVITGIVSKILEKAKLLGR